MEEKSIEGYQRQKTLFGLRKSFSEAESILGKYHTTVWWSYSSSAPWESARSYGGDRRAGLQDLALNETSHPYATPSFPKGLATWCFKLFPFHIPVPWGNPETAMWAPERSLQTLLIPDVASLSSLHKVSRHLTSQRECRCPRGFSPNKYFIIKVTVTSE